MKRIKVIAGISLLTLLLGCSGKSPVDAGKNELNESSSSEILSKESSSSIILFSSSSSVEVLPSSSSLVASGTKGCGTSPTLINGLQTITVDGVARQYYIDIPTNYNNENEYVLIFAWHWRDGNASDLIDKNTGWGSGAYYGLKAKSENSAIFISAEGLDKGWANTNDRDLKFLTAILKAVKTDLCVDTTRIFSTGFSYGGMMSNAIGCSMGEVFRAVAPMSGSLWSGCAKKANAPASILFHGTGDDVVPISAGKEALNTYFTRNHCSSTTKSIGKNGCVEYDGCDDGKPVVWCEFNGKHSTPTFSAEETWAFFSRF